MSKRGQKILGFLREYKPLCEKHNLCVTGCIGAATAVIDIETYGHDWLRSRIVETVEEEDIALTEKVSILKELGY